MVDKQIIQEINDRLEAFRQKLPIDQFQLEIACINQPVLYDEVGQLLTECRSWEKAANDKLQFIHADQSSRIRHSPEKYGVIKITEPSVESAILLTKEYQEATKDLVEFEKIVGYLKVLQTSLNHRKSELSNLVQLWVRSYYSKLDMTTEKKVVNEITEQQIVQERIRNAAKRREEPETEQK